MPPYFVSCPCNPPPHSTRSRQSGAVVHSPTLDHLKPLASLDGLTPSLSARMIQLLVWATALARAISSDGVDDSEISYVGNTVGFALTCFFLLIVFAPILCVCLGSRSIAMAISPPCLGRSQFHLPFFCRHVAAFDCRQGVAAEHPHLAC